MVTEAARAGTRPALAIGSSPFYGVSLLILVYQLASETRVAPQLPKPAKLGGAG